jgi:hypothetical protein
MSGVDTGDSKINLVAMWSPFRRDLKDPLCRAPVEFTSQNGSLQWLVNSGHLPLQLDPLDEGLLPLEARSGVG